MDIYLDASRLGIYIHHYSRPLRGIVVYYSRHHVLPVFTVTPPSKPFNKLSQESKRKKKMNVQTLSQGSGLCNVSCGRYSKKCFTQIYKAMYGDAMFVSLWGTQIWRPEARKNICHRVFDKEPVLVFRGLMNIYMRTYSHTRTVQIVKSQRINYFF